MNVVDILSDISFSVDKLCDFVVEDEFLSKDFEKYLEKYNVQIEVQSQFLSVVMHYLFDEKTENGQRILDYCILKQSADAKILAAFKNSFKGIFEVKKISNNALNVYSLINEKEFTLISLTKTVNLRGLGRNDFLNARIIEFNETFYILEIFDIIGSNSFHIAYKEALKMLLNCPKLLCFKNNEKLLELKKTQKNISSEFVNFFKTNEIVTSNKNADILLNDFNKYLSDKTVKFDKNLIERFEKFEYFEIDENDDDNFVENALSGFSKSEKIYDVGIYSDENLGFFTIPFLGTFNETFKNYENVENYENCIFDFLISDKIPPSVFEKQENALEIINLVLEKKKFETFSTLDDVISYFKCDYLENHIVSKPLALYSSKLFKDYLEFLSKC